jgi:hypothetical protein
MRCSMTSRNSAGTRRPDDPTDDPIVNHTEDDPAEQGDTGERDTPGQVGRQRSRLHFDDEDDDTLVGA